MFAAKGVVDAIARGQLRAGRVSSAWVGYAVRAAPGWF
jgi:hypothetical protein